MRVDVHNSRGAGTKPVPAGTKITRDAFLYLEPRNGGGPFAQCGTCALRLTYARQMCAVMSRPIESGASCALYVEGSPRCAATLSDLSPAEVGYVVRQVRCENCRYGGDECELYKTLNQRAPEIFDLDPGISPRGCCNAQEPR